MINSGTILIADDDNAIRTVLNQALGRAGYNIRTTGNAATLWKWVLEGEGNLVITDVFLPDGNGLDLIPRIKKIRPNLQIIAMSAQNTMMTAVNATQRGAFEYLPKPFDLTELISVVNRALNSLQVQNLGHLRDDKEQLPLIGGSQAMQEVYRTLARLMNTDLTVLINGESGTGKELAAKALHDYGKRKNHPFVAINMAAIPRELIESELFGHEKGSFTGAINRVSGRFEQANNGTLFLDEIGDMPQEAQTRLLRVLQDGEYTTIGGKISIKTNVRIIAATHRDLTQLIRHGLFREDLYYRLNVVPVRMPPLRERRDDIPELVRHFLFTTVNEGLPNKMLDSPAIELLKTYHWPGNVRELENLIRRLAVLYSQDTIGIDVIEAELSTSDTSQNSERAAGGIGEAIEYHLQEYFDAHGANLPPIGLYDRVLREIERPLITLSLSATRGNQLRAAHLLGLNRNTLRKKIRELNILVTRTSR